jgi:hypothetical protein
MPLTLLWTSYRRYVELGIDKIVQKGGRVCRLSNQNLNIIIENFLLNPDRKSDRLFCLVVYIEGTVSWDLENIRIISLPND